MSEIEASNGLLINIIPATTYKTPRIKWKKSPAHLCHQKVKPSIMMTIPPINNRKPKKITDISVVKVVALIATTPKRSNNNPQKELAALAGTVHKLFLLVSNTYRLDDNILMLPRNKRREIASQVVYSGTFIATATTSTVLFPTPLGAVASLAYVAPMTTQKVGEISGLNDTTPESMRIVNQLYKHLSELDQHLKRKYYNQKFQNDDDEKIRKYTCPITLCIMNDPVACRLDGFSYERVAIEQWLREKRNSPINRSRIPAGQTIQDVLTTNRNLKTAINDFLSENPAIIDDEIETKPKLVILKT